MAEKLLIATGSRFKIAHWNALFQDYFTGIEIVGPDGNDIKKLEVEERGDGKATYFDNALLKAKAYWEAYHVPVLSDDSGLEINSLNRWPGIITSRALESGVNDKTRADAFIEALKDHPDYPGRCCEWHTCVVFIDRRGHIFYCNTLRYGWVAKVKMGGDMCNEVEKVFIPYQDFMMPDECPDDEDPNSTLTLGVLNTQRKYGQHYQTTIAYPVSDNVPTATFLDTVQYLVTKDTDDDAKVFEDYLKLEIGKPYEFRVPVLPQILVEKIHTSVF